MPLGVGWGQNVGLRDFAIFWLCCRPGHPCFTNTCLVQDLICLWLKVIPFISLLPANQIFIKLCRKVVSWPWSNISKSPANHGFNSILLCISAFCEWISIKLSTNFILQRCVMKLMSWHEPKVTHLISRLSDNHGLYSIPVCNSVFYGWISIKLCTMFSMDQRCACHDLNTRSFILSEGHQVITAFVPFCSVIQHLLMDSSNVNLCTK